MKYSYPFRTDVLSKTCFPMRTLKTMVVGQSDVSQAPLAQPLAPAVENSTSCSRYPLPIVLDKYTVPVSSVGNLTSYTKSKSPDVPISTNDITSRVPMNPSFVLHNNSQSTEVREPSIMYVAM